MGLGDRIRTILNENNLSQKELAIILNTSPGHISNMINCEKKNIGNSMAALIEVRLGYCTEWVLTGKGPKYVTEHDYPTLSPYHQRLIFKITKLDVQKVKATLAFIDSLNTVTAILNEMPETAQDIPQVPQPDNENQTTQEP